MRVVSDKRERAPAYGRLPIEDSLAELGYCGGDTKEKTERKHPYTAKYFSEKQWKLHIFRLDLKASIPITGLGSELLGEVSRANNMQWIFFHVSSLHPPTDFTRPLRHKG